MPVYNAGKYLVEAIDSILAQTYVDFEFIIVDDGSTDESWATINRYAAQDTRVVPVQNNQNRGIVYTLNRGLSMSKGKYIARMDSDDISLPDRLAKQVNYFDQHPSVGLLGTNIAYIDEHNQLINQGRPKHHSIESKEFIQWSMLWRCALYHPTIMLRKQVLEKTGYRYEESFKYAEDYDLWTRLMEHTSVYRLHDVLVQMRVLSSSISRKYNEEQRSLVSRIRRREITKYLGEIPCDSGLDTLCKVFSYDTVPDGDFQTATNILFLMYRRFLDSKPSTVSKSEVLSDVVERQARIAYTAANSGQLLLSLALFTRICSLSVRKLFSKSTLLYAWYILWGALNPAKRITSESRGQ